MGSDRIADRVIVKYNAAVPVVKDHPVAADEDVVANLQIRLRRIDQVDRHRNVTASVPDIVSVYFEVLAGFRHQERMDIGRRVVVDRAVAHPGDDHAVSVQSGKCISGDHNILTCLRRDVMISDAGEDVAEGASRHRHVLARRSVERNRLVGVSDTRKIQLDRLRHVCRAADLTVRIRRLHKIVKIHVADSYIFHTGQLDKVITAALCQLRRCDGDILAVVEEEQTLGVQSVSAAVLVRHVAVPFSAANDDVLQSLVAAFFYLACLYRSVSKHRATVIRANDNCIFIKPQRRVGVDSEIPADMVLACGQVYDDRVVGTVRKIQRLLDRRIIVFSVIRLCTDLRCRHVDDAFRPYRVQMNGVPRPRGISQPLFVGDQCDVLVRIRARPHSSRGGADQPLSVAFLLRLPSQEHAALLLKAQFADRGNSRAVHLVDGRHGRVRRRIFILMVFYGKRVLGPLCIEVNHGADGRGLCDCTAVAVQLITAALGNRGRPAFVAVGIPDAPLLVVLAVYLPAAHRKGAVCDPELTACVRLRVHAEADTLRRADRRRRIAGMEFYGKILCPDPLSVEMYNGSDRRCFCYRLSVSVQIILRVGIDVLTPHHVAGGCLHRPAVVRFAIHLPSLEGSVRIAEPELLIRERRRRIPVIDLTLRTCRRSVVILVIANGKLYYVIPGRIEVNIFPCIYGARHRTSVAVCYVGVAAWQRLRPAFLAGRILDSPGLIQLTKNPPPEEPLLFGRKTQLLNGLGLRVRPEGDCRRGPRCRSIQVRMVIDDKNTRASGSRGCRRDALNNQKQNQYNNKHPSFHSAFNVSFRHIAPPFLLFLLLLPLTVFILISIIQEIKSPVQGQSFRLCKYDKLLCIFAGPATENGCFRL